LVTLRFAVLLADFAPRGRELAGARDLPLALAFERPLVFFAAGRRADFAGAGRFDRLFAGALLAAFTRLFELVFFALFLVAMLSSARVPPVPEQLAFPCSRCPTTKEPP
jgi:hypothetical protein